MKRIHFDLKKKPTEKVHANTVVAIVFSVLFAFILWFYIQGEESPDYTATFNAVEVGCRSLPEGLSLISGSGTVADITLTGKKMDLNKVKSGNIEAYMDLSGITKAGVYDVDMTVISPEGTQVSSTFPEKVQVMVDVTLQKSVPVTVEKGEYTTLSDTTLEVVPQDTTVEIKGPKTIVDTVSEARVFTGDLGEVNSSFERNISFSLTDTSGNAVSASYLTFDKKTVNVEFNVTKTKTVQTRLDFVNGYWAGNVEYSLSPSSVVIKGEPSYVDTISSIAVARIDETTVNTNRLFKNISPEDFVLPDGIKIAESIGEVQADIRITDNVSKNIRIFLNSSHVYITNPSANLNYKFSFDVTNLTVRGRTADVPSATTDDFYLYIDLSMFATPGNYTAQIKVVQTDASKGKYYPVGEYSVGVNLFE